MLRSAHHVGLTVMSIKRSKDFYCGILGFEELFTWNPQAPYVGELVGYPTVDLHSAILRLPGTDLCLELLEYRNVVPEEVPRGNGNPGTAHLAFFVDGLEDIFRLLVSRGVPSLSPPVTPTLGPNAGGRVVYMIDPDGFRIELIESALSFADYRHEEA